jgi:4-amino-4-deoxy-L-arabinose transferase-like glycosyltransferase
MSIVFGCGAAAMIYALADNWFGRNAALFAGLIFVFSPLAWFHGTVALTYIVETFFSALTGYLCWRIRGCRVRDRSGRFILPCAVVAGVAAGFRPSSLLLLGPLLLFSLRRTSFRQAAGGIAALAATLLAWFIPMLRITGGEDYFSSLLSLWLTVPSRGMVFNSSVLNSFARFGVVLAAYFLFFGCAPILSFRTSRPRPSDRPKTIFTLAWIAPGLLFFTFIYLKFVNSGYLLALSPPLCAWMGLRVSQWYANTRLPKSLRILTVAGCAAANTLAFVYAPVYCSYASVRLFERELASVIRVLPQVAPSRDTLIVGFDSHFLGYRHAGYYLPGYRTVQFPEVQLAQGKRIFTMENRNTSLRSGIDCLALRRFILFPLPSGDAEYTDYTALVRKRFPAGTLHIVTKEDHEFAMGAIADPGFLFPCSH